MNRRAFVKSAAAVSLLGLTVDPASSGPTKLPVERLIEELGSKRFREREAASKALAEMDQAAIAPLQKAAERHPDPEVRRRAASLISDIHARQARHFAEQVRAIIKSKLGPAEKGRKLQPFLQHGMSSAQVRQLLGLPDLSVGGDVTQDDVYRLLGLRIAYHARSVGDWFVIGVKLIAAH